MIPKTIHQIFWKFKDKELDEIPSFKRCVEKTRKYCDKYGYQHRMWNLDDIQKLLCENYLEYIQLWTDFEMEIQRCDFIRYVILHRFGGWYLDCDLYPLKDLSPLESNDVVFTQWNNDKRKLPYYAIMGSIPNNPLWLKVMKCSERRTYEKQSMPIYQTWRGRLLFQTTGHFMLNEVIDKSTVLDLVHVVNEEKGIDISCEDPYFYDENATVWATFDLVGNLTAEPERTKKVY